MEEMSTPPIILASASPQRKRLLEGLGVRFEVVTSTIDESLCEEKDPAKRAVVLAEMKAGDVYAHRSDSFVIGCDTLVVAPDGTLLEKPANRDEAHTMLKKQSGGTSVVHSGLCIFAPDGKSVSALSSSNVIFKTLMPEDIEWWGNTELWKDRSGAFQIDGLGQLMIERIEGDWSSIVGLPVFLLGELARKVGMQLVHQEKVTG